MNTVAVASPSITLPALPYAQNALDPVMSANTLGFHYGKHHKAYVDTLNKLIAGSEFADMPLEEIVKATSGKSDRAAIFNNAAQDWNHTFYWRSLKPKGGGEPPAALKRLLESSFGSVEACKKELATAAVGQFGQVLAEEVATLLRMTQAWVYSETRQDRIPHMRFGRRFRYRRSAIEAWMGSLERSRPGELQSLNRNASETFAASSARSRKAM